jgi:antitoxin ParD1/3/4
MGMGKNTSFSVGEHFIGFIEAQVSEGRYSSASDVVRAGLRLLEEQEAKLAALRAALIEGEESGVSTRSVHDIWAAVKARRERSGLARG